MCSMGSCYVEFTNIGFSEYTVIFTKQHNVLFVAKMVEANSAREKKTEVTKSWNNIRIRD